MIATDRAKRSNYKKSDIAGQRFGRLIAVCPTDMRDNHGSVVWHCCCDCGNEIDVPYNSLVYCHMKSCGCQKREHETNLGRFLGHTNGTAVAMLKSTKTFSNNTTGYRGVYFVNGKYLAKIVFQKKQYHLGKYDTAEEAAEVRKQAEEKLFLGFADYYEQWKTLADTDPDWASANPIQVLVNKTVSEVFLSITPELPLISGARKNTKVGAKWEKAKTCQENISGT